MCASLIDFNYLAIVGNSGTGKTTLVKTVLNRLAWDRLYLCDPNRQYSDFTVNENATYISPGELKDALNVIGKRLLLTRKKGVLLIEDLAFTLERLCETLQVNEKKARKVICLLLENLRKYDVKVIVVMHDVDRDIVGKCDTKVFFQTPLNDYAIRQYSNFLNMDMKPIVSLSRFNYLSKNGGDMEHGYVEPLESHMQIEHDKSFMVKEILAKCQSLPQKVLVLRLHLELKNSEIACMLGLDLHTVENLVWRLRRRGVIIADGRKSFALEKLAF